MPHTSLLRNRNAAMAASALAQVRSDAAVKEDAAAVLGHLSLTVTGAMRILLSRTVNEGALPFALAVDPAAHDAWFRWNVQQALDDSPPAIARDRIEAQFAKRRE